MSKKEIYLKKGEHIVLTVEGLENFPFPIRFEDAFAFIATKLGQDAQQNLQRVNQEEAAKEAAHAVAAAAANAGLPHMTVKPVQPE
jgi:hypothetical protein